MEGKREGGGGKRRQKDKQEAEVIGCCEMQEHDRSNKKAGLCLEEKECITKLWQSVTVYSDLGQYLSGQDECISVGSISRLVLFNSSVYKPYLQSCLPSYTPS